MSNFVKVEIVNRALFTGEHMGYINKIINLDKVVEVDAEDRTLDFGANDYSMEISEASMKKVLERIGMKDEVRNI